MTSAPGTERHLYCETSSAVLLVERTCARSSRAALGLPPLFTTRRRAAPPLPRGREVGGRVEQFGHELAGAFALALGVLGGDISDALSAP